MLKPANLYTADLHVKFVESMYDMKYKYYHFGTSASIPTIDDTNNWFHQFVSVNDKGEILGYIMYGVNYETMSVPSFGAISFIEGGSVTYAHDLLQAIDNIFMVYNFNRMEWNCCIGNPAVRGYRNLCKRFGGREVGQLHQNIKLMDGKIYDTVIFEVMREDYIKSKERKK